MILGRPSIAYGIVRRLAHIERRKRCNSYLRIHLGGVGRSGGHGGWDLEVNGNIYRFHHNIKSYPTFHDGVGHLTTQGQYALATGLPGVVSAVWKAEDSNQGYDWHWVQGEIDLTHKLTDQAMDDVSAYFHEMALGTVSPPMYQSRRWAENWGEPIKPSHHNCVTIILEQLRQVWDISIDESLPIEAFPALCHVAGTAPFSVMENDVIVLLNRPEKEVEGLLHYQAQAHGEQVNWKAFAKGEVQAPDWLTLSSLDILGEHKDIESFPAAGEGYIRCRDCGKMGKESELKLKPCHSQYLIKYWWRF